MSFPKAIFLGLAGGVLIFVAGCVAGALAAP